MFIWFFILFVNSTLPNGPAYYILNAKSAVLNLFEKSVSKGLARTAKRVEVIQNLLLPRNVELY